jgi:transketolase
MRTAFIETLCDLASQDERIWLLTGDLGYSVLERFAERFPGRFVNVGVAEQNMMGVAAGLALCGKIVFTYSIANFPTMRCLEQIRNDVCHHNLNVKIVAVGGGLAYGAAGYTHYAVEDLAVMRALPNIAVIAPGDPVESRCATRAVAAHPGPCYLRLGKGGEPVIHSSQPSFQIGKAIMIQFGTDLTLISTGGVLELAVKAARELVRENRSIQVLSMPSIQPLDDTAVLDAACRTNAIVTVEEHGPGGLASAVAEVLTRTGRPIRFAGLGLPRETPSVAGSQAALRAQHGLTVANIVKTAHEIMNWTG